MPRNPQEAEYSIAAVSKLTGASCHALRVWERRYGFPVPERSASGHRRFSREQVTTLRTITELAHTGRPIGELIAEYLDGRLAIAEPVATPDVSDEEGAFARLVDGLVEGKLEDSEGDYRRLTQGLAPAAIVSRIIGPAWIEAGERWFRRECGVYQERIISEFLGRKLEVLIDDARRRNDRPSRSIVVGTVQGDRHEGGVLMLSLILEEERWRVINLGVDLPVREYSAAIRHWKPDALALSFVLSRNIKKRFEELSRIGEVPIFVGGRSILNYQGLARRHGLVPLPGPITQAVIQLQVEYDHWSKIHASHADS